MSISDEIWYFNRRRMSKIIWEEYGIFKKREIWREVYTRNRQIVHAITHLQIKSLILDDLREYLGEDN